MKATSPMKPIILIVICTFFWGSSLPMGKEALNEMQPLSIVFWRFFIAALGLAAYLLFTHIRMPNLDIKKWLWIIIVSAIGIGGLNYCVFTGLTLTNAANGSLIMALSPLFTSLIVCVVSRTLPSRVQLLSLFISLFGVLIVLTNGHLDRLLSMSFNHGDKLIFIGMLAWSMYTYFSGGINRWIPVLPYTFIGMSTGVIVIGAMCATSAGPNPFIELWDSSAIGISEVLYIGLFGTFAGYLMWLNGISKLGSAKAVLFFNLVPIFSVITASLLGQKVTELQVVGIIVVITGLLLPRFPHFKKQPNMCTKS